MTTKHLRTLLILGCISSGSAILMGSVMIEILGLAFPVVYTFLAAGFAFCLALFLHHDGADDV